MDKNHEHKHNKTDNQHSHDHGSHDHDSDEHGSHNHDSHDHGSHDHTQHHKMMIKDFKKRFWISLILTIPILALSAMIQNVFGYQLSFNLDSYVLFGLSTIIS